MVTSEGIILGHGAQVSRHTSRRALLAAMLSENLLIQGEIGQDEDDYD